MNLAWLVTPAPAHVEDSDGYHPRYDMDDTLRQRLTDDIARLPVSPDDKLAMEQRVESLAAAIEEARECGSKVAKIHALLAMDMTRIARTAEVARINRNGSVLGGLWGE